MMLSQQNLRFKTACRTCRDRKVKCDKVLPCQNCTAADIVCSFPPQVRTVRRPKKATAAAGGKVDKAVLDRVNRLEALLKKHAPHLPLDDEERGGDSNNAYSDDPWGRRRRNPIATDDLASSASIRADCPLTSFTPPKEPTPNSVFQDGVVTSSESARDQWSISPAPAALQSQREGRDGDADDANYWNRLQEECASHIFLRSPSTTIENVNKPSSRGKQTTPTDQPKNTSTDTAQPPPPYHTGFPFQQPERVMPPALLSLKERRVCWRRFVENIDPVLKILHKPTMEGLISVRDVHAYAMNPSIVALIQAICLIAITSMSEEDVSKNHNSDRETLMRTCGSLTEQALMAADFLETQELTTIQAVLLFLYYLKHTGDGRLYALCGTAVCLAIRMGLHRDTAGCGLPRLEVELRRRLWWQLVNLVDHPDNTGLDCYMALTVGANTRFPLNIDDSELERNRGEERSGFTEASFCLMQYEITRAFNQIRYERTHAFDDQGEATLDRAERRLLSSRELMESKYLRGCADGSPLGKFAADTISMVLAKRRLLMHISPDLNSQNGTPSPATKDHLFLYGIHVLELSRTLQTAQTFQKWRWLSATYFQWAIANFIAKELAVRQRSAATRRAWKVIDGILDAWPEATRNSTKSSALKSLIAEATQRRDSENIWNLSLSSSTSMLDDPENHFFYPPEMAHRKTAMEKNKRETAMHWTAANPNQQYSGFSPLMQTMAMDNYFVPELAFGESVSGLAFDLI